MVTKEVAQQLLNLVKGCSGRIHLQNGFKHDDFEITGPATFDLKEENGDLKITFVKPYPTGKYKFLKKHVTGIQLTLSQLTVELDWAPDVKIKIS